MRIWSFIVALLFSLSSMAQTAADVVLHGTVVDELGEPLIGATLKLKKSGQGTVTNIDGVYQLSADRSDVVTISYIGYQPQTFAVSRLAQMKTIKMQPDKSQD